MFQQKVMRGLIALQLVTALTFSLFSPAIPVASADHGDTQHCENHSSSGLALPKIESDNGSEAVNGVEIEWSGDPGSVTFTNNNLVDATIMWCAKGGTNFSGADKNTHTVTTNVLAGEDITVGPLGTEISYFLVYNVELDEPETGSITIVKNAINDSNQVFHFTTNGLSTDNTGFDLVDDSTPGEPERVFSDLSAGVYTVNEDDTQGWDFDGVSCTRGASVQENGASIAITLAEGEDVTCTYTNREEPEVLVDYCDPTQRPAGHSIAQWLSVNQVNGADCFDYTVTNVCGQFNTQFTKNETGYAYEFRYVVDNQTPTLANWAGDGVLPVQFSEDENGGSVEVTYYAVGPEKDYFVGFGIPNIWDGNGVAVEIDTDCQEPEVLVDYCDPTQRPAGQSIAQWLAANQVDASDCIDYTVTNVCGQFNAQFTKNETGYGYEFRYALGNSVPENWEGDGALPVNFSEDQNSGTVTLTYYIVGPEKDYFVGFGMPNFWDGNGVTVEVDTDCLPNEEPKGDLDIIKMFCAEVPTYNPTDYLRVFEQVAVFGCDSEGVPTANVLFSIFAGDNTEGTPAATAEIKAEDLVNGVGIATVEDLEFGWYTVCEVELENYETWVKSNPILAFVPMFGDNYIQDDCVTVYVGEGGEAEFVNVPVPTPTPSPTPEVTPTPTPTPTPGQVLGEQVERPNVLAAVKQLPSTGAASEGMGLIMALFLGAVLTRRRIG